MYLGFPPALQGLLCLGHGYLTAQMCSCAWLEGLLPSQMSRALQENKELATKRDLPARPNI
jgi:hypothetical protein